MRLRHIVLTWMVLAGSVTLVPAQAPATSPDELYAQREQPGRARQAADIWKARLAANGRDFEAAWKLARAMYWLGGDGPSAARRRDLEEGVEAGRRAIAIDGNRPDGHFWMAANMGALAQSFGLRQGIRYRGPVKEALERVLAIDPAYQQGSADRALGRWYFKVPGLFGGSNAKAELHLKRSLTHAPNSTASLVFLAEVYLDTGRRTEARALLQQVVDGPVDPEWAPEDRRFKAEAKRLLQATRP
jgi:tetratricopeptide (TPR) repeat protein